MRCRSSPKRYGEVAGRHANASMLWPDFLAERRGGVPGSSPRKAQRVFRAFGTSGHGADAVLREKPYLFILLPWPLGLGAIRSGSMGCGNFDNVRFPCCHYPTCSAASPWPRNHRSSSFREARLPSPRTPNRPRAHSAPRGAHRRPPEFGLAGMCLMRHVRNANSTRRVGIARRDSREGRLLGARSTILITSSRKA